MKCQVCNDDIKPLCGTDVCSACLYADGPRRATAPTTPITPEALERLRDVAGIDRPQPGLVGVKHDDLRSALSTIDAQAKVIDLLQKKLDRIMKESLENVAELDAENRELKAKLAEAECAQHFWHAEATKAAADLGEARGAIERLEKGLAEAGAAETRLDDERDRDVKIAVDAAVKYRAERDALTAEVAALRAAFERFVRAAPTLSADDYEAAFHVLGEAHAGQALLQRLEAAEALAKNAEAAFACGFDHEKQFRQMETAETERDAARDLATKLADAVRDALACVNGDINGWPLAEEQLEDRLAAFDDAQKTWGG